MTEHILTNKQIDFLKTVGSTPAFAKSFYLTGGTALAGFYIPYRYSEDLDFFSEQEVDLLDVQTFIKHHKTKLGISGTEYQTSFNRNLVFITFTDGTTLKSEFTYFPFTRLNTGTTYFDIIIDSTLDIAINKLFTIYQRTAARDYMDLYQLCKAYSYTIPELIAKARLKFDTHIDLLKLGSQFNKATEASDLPKLVKPLQNKAWRDFFTKEAYKLKRQIIT